MGTTGQDRLTESNGSLNNVKMKRVFETAECEEAGSSIFLVHRYERFCRELNVNDWDSPIARLSDTSLPNTLI